MRNLFLISLLILAFVCMACPKQTQPPSGNPAGNTASSGQGDASAMTPHQGNPGETKVTSNALPQEWPLDVQIMPNFTIINSTSANPQGAKVMTVIATGVASLDDATAFYSNLAGWEKDDRAPWLTSGEQRYIKYRRGTENLSINIRTQDGKTQLNIVYNISPATTAPR